MLFPKAFRQRLSIELRTGRDIYSDDLIENFIEDLVNTTDIKKKEIIVLAYSKVGLISIDILSKSSFLISDILNIMDFWFDTREVDIV